MGQCPRMDNQEKHATLSIRQKQNKDEQNKNKNNFVSTCI
jgi:hypothetical protein